MVINQMLKALVPWIGLAAGLYAMLFYRRHARRAVAGQNQTWGFRFGSGAERLNRALFLLGGAAMVWFCLQELFRR